MTAPRLDPPSRQSVLEALGAYQKRGRISYEVADMADLLIDESDRGIVVILGSLVEDILLERLLMSFIDMNASATKNLTRGGGLLSSFDHRITLARSLGIIDQDMVEMLQTVKAMRNACAHSRLDIGFSTPELRDALSLLFDEPNAWGIRISRTPVAHRFMFIVAFVYITTILRGQSPEIAAAKSQHLMDELLIEASLAVAKHKASLEKRRKRRAERPQKSRSGQAR